MDSNKNQVIVNKIKVTKWVLHLILGWMYTYNTPATDWDFNLNG